MSTELRNFYAEFLNKIIMVLLAIIPSWGRIKPASWLFLSIPYHRSVPYQSMNKQQAVQKIAEEAGQRVHRLFLQRQRQFVWFTSFVYERAGVVGEGAGR